MEEKRKKAIMKKIELRIKEQENKLDSVLGSPGISESQISRFLGIIEQLEKARTYFSKKK